MKKLLSLALALVICLGLTIPASAVEKAAAYRNLAPYCYGNVSECKISAEQARAYASYIEDFQRRVDSELPEQGVYPVEEETYSALVCTGAGQIALAVACPVVYYANHCGDPELVQYANGQATVWENRGCFLVAKDCIYQISVNESWYNGNVPVYDYQNGRIPENPTRNLDILTSDYNAFVESIEQADTTFLEFYSHNTTAYFSDPHFEDQSGLANNPDCPITHGYTLAAALRAYANEVDQPVNDADASTGGTFTDVAADAFYAAPVAWAVEKNITKGTSATAFSPNGTCKIEQILTFLWRAAGSPASTAPCPFGGLEQSSPYYPALCWASEKGILKGESTSAGKDCTRIMAVNFMYRYAGSPESTTRVGFLDVPGGQMPAVLWALDNGVTNGTGNGNFSPEKTCTRGEIVTFLYRAFADK